MYSKILTRYILRLLASHILITTCVLLAISLATEIVDLLALTVRGVISGDLAIQFVLLCIPSLLTWILPLAMYLGSMLAWSKMYIDNEITAMFSGGVGYYFLVRQIFKICLPLTILVYIFSFYLSPYARDYTAHLKRFNQGSVVNVVNNITPGRFNELGNRVLYVENMDNSGVMYDLVILEDNISDQKNNVDKFIINAKRAVIKNISDTSYLLTLYDGFRYLGEPGEANYTVVEFDEFQQYINFDGIREFSQSTSMHSNTTGTNSQFHWDLAMPISCIIFCLMALPLAKTNARQGKFAKFFIAVFIYILYINLLLVFRSWIELKTIPAIIGLWPIHVLFLSIAIGLVKYNE